ncbi:hypothetical protein JAO29_14875 [Edaphobacter sp. HDX4]|uniref:hypothetical protein n=1 Tax=Edaphobacter sp. HDX4 TaxID=2794064 RepID=UPI002FE56EC9
MSYESVVLPSGVLHHRYKYLKGWYLGWFVNASSRIEDKPDVAVNRAGASSRFCFATVFAPFLVAFFAAFFKDFLAPLVAIFLAFAGGFFAAFFTAFFKVAFPAFSARFAPAPVMRAGGVVFSRASARNWSTR